MSGKYLINAHHVALFKNVHDVRMNPDTFLVIIENLCVGGPVKSCRSRRGEVDETTISTAKN